MSSDAHRHNGDKVSIIHVDSSDVFPEFCSGANGGEESSFRSKLKDEIDAFEALPILPGEPTYEDVQTMYNKEKKKLKFEERETIVEEIHGVPVRQPENAEMVEAALKRFRASVEYTKKRHAYDLAKLMNPSYVNDEKLHLMALRAERFDPTKAAKRFVQHFDLKLELFGVDCLARPILFSDLDEIDRAALNAGYFQILCNKDQTGRAVAVLAQRYHREHEMIRAKFRIAWYLMMKTVQNDEQVQQNGFVGVVYNVGLGRPSLFCIFEQIKLGSRFVNAVMVKYASFHYCYDNELLQKALALFQFSFGKTILMRSKWHYGSHLECQGHLRSFGIPMDSFPIGQDGSHHTSKHLQWIEQLQVQDEELRAIQSASGRIFPTQNDVLFGRGKNRPAFPGNQYFNAKVEEKRPDYLLAGKNTKTQYTKQMVRHIQYERGGRFLKLKKDSPHHEWEVVSDKVAHDKTTATFRSPYDPDEKKKSPKKKKNNCQKMN